MKKNVLKFLVLSLAISMVALSAMGCSKSPTSKTKTIKIGLAISTLTMTWPQYATAAIQKEAKAEGVNVVVTDANNDVEKQASIIDDFIAEKVDGIITNPINVTSLATALSDASTAKIPVAVFDREAVGSPYTDFVGGDDVKAGQMAADYLAKKLDDKGNVVEIVGANGASPSIDRHNGFTSEMKKYPNMSVVFSESGQFVRETGMTVMEAAIAKTHSNFQGVYAANDDMMMGALQAMQASNIDVSKIATVSNDAIPDVLKQMEAGVLDCSIDYPVAMAPASLKLLITYIKTGVAPSPKNQKVEPFYVEKSNITQADFYPELSKTSSSAS